MKPATVELAGETLLLLPQRALYWPARQVLLVADVHLGKAASFRRLGVPVPEQTTAGTLERLDAALALSGARQIVFLGDLLHARLGRTAATLSAVQHWRARHPDLTLVLLRGNHDRHAGDPPAEWGVTAVDEPWQLGPFALKHHPDPEPAAYVLAGHVHPGVVLGGRAHDRLRLPCFHFGERVGLLPAFGEFTGLHVVARGGNDRVFVVQGETVRSLHTLPACLPSMT